MTDKVIRIFKIINAIQSNPGITASALAIRCDVNIRTVYRDLEIISHFAPVTNEGRGTGYKFLGKFFLYPLDFSEQEALAFSLLPSFLNQDKIPPGFHTAYDKVMGTHLKEKSKQNGILENIADIIQMGKPAYRKKSRNFLQPIIGAILEQRSIRAIYHSQSRNALTQREIDPYYLIPRDQRFYLIGYCHLKQAIRTFRISRFQEVEVTDRSFDKGNFNIKKYLKNTWSIDRGNKNIKFRVRFHPEIARYIKEEELFVHPWMSDENDGSLLFEVTVNNEKEFTKWILQYGPNAEILEPASAREGLKVQLEQWMRLYQK
ncbi:helix-turn-helix transcriptional regulator [Paenibacillus riograndensis]|uniref:Transcriptional regulator n=2 Tax=Paenibacillus riograndensis TaxID=483937 RepID=A0A132TNJ7_9BACL|nr:WYL domain-containing protein [Paenibacillus riograndensis]KWX72895.1 transcriptional regulator [Paenibacillus riograndensis]KWX87901.1 transcriptional regulator [Paenibacillus riograndensis]CQR52790.1 HTH domain protein [Paenibacillus riograndensis SBR5]